jgi:hypothetical protein
MKTRTWVIAAAVVLLGAGGAWYFASPAYAMSQLRDAAVEGDAEDLKERIDFPAVRSSLKEQMRAMLAAEMTKADNDNPFGAFGSMLAMGMVDGMVEGFVNPESMAAMIKQGKMQRPGQTAAKAVSDEPPAEWSIERDGLDGFRAVPSVEKGVNPPTLIFERDGLGWNLVGIDLPERLPGGDEPAS